MSNLTNEQLQMLERCGAALTKPSEAARLVGMSVDDLKIQLTDPECAAYEYYYRGLENTRLELRERTIAIAKQGSSPAQTLSFNLINELSIELYD